MGSGPPRRCPGGKQYAEETWGLRVVPCTGCDLGEKGAIPGPSASFAEGTSGVPRFTKGVRLSRRWQDGVRPSGHFCARGPESAESLSLGDGGSSRARTLTGAPGRGSARASGAADTLPSLPPGDKLSLSGLCQEHTGNGLFFPPRVIHSLQPCSFQSLLPVPWPGLGQTRHFPGTFEQ